MLYGRALVIFISVIAPIISSELRSSTRWVIPPTISESKESEFQDYQPAVDKVSGSKRRKSATSEV
jgi:hypothetical protein